MAEYDDREHFIPMRVTDLVTFLCRDTGANANQKLSDSECQTFHRFADMLVSHYHLEYHAQLNALKDAYAPFDPDSDTKSLEPLEGEARATQQKQVFVDVHELLSKANYTHLTRQELEKTIEGASAWGLEMHVDWTVFDRLEVYYRGDEMQTRSRRPWWRLWIKQEMQVPTFKRVVIMIKQKPGSKLDGEADTDNLYMKLFKNMPQVDLEMVLPGTRVKLSRLDKAMIIYPVLMGFGILTYKLLREFVFESLPEIEMLKKVGGITAIGILLGGYAYRSYYSYSVKKTTYTLQLTKSLYYQTLDGNAGVLHRLLDEAEEQEVREALLAYYYLWRHAPSDGWTGKQLDDHIENELLTKLNLKIDFEIGDAINKLERLRIVENRGGKLVVPPLDKALKIILEKPLSDSVPPSSSGDAPMRDDRDLMASLKL